jgi:uncharacterized membrane protein YphA (DoxX/SURF4 family)
VLNLSAYSSWGDLALRLVVGAVFIYHGWSKIKNPKGIASAIGVPSVVGLAQGLVEVVGSLALILNRHVQLVGLLFGLIMVGAIYYKKFKWHVSFYAHDKAGWELDLVLLGASLFYFLR